MDLVIFGLTAAGLHIAIDIILLCAHAVKHKTTKTTRRANNVDFKIGDNIRVVPYDELPAERKNKGIARACDKEGVIIDKLYSGKENRYVYKVQLHTCNEPSSISFTDDMLTLSGGG